ncbi:hypothetical protein E2C01_002167 [Portunus trituberculatus]|uniref:Uncharacterized protein n=1 Tax=Portunus trituberculatus TaxID=210409 RepID=A0A5B7CIP1_PORTR|nr:hypothetical protein [Portunus trituberculatus]
MSRARRQRVTPPSRPRVGHVRWLSVQRLSLIMHPRDAAPTGTLERAPALTGRVSGRADSLLLPPIPHHVEASSGVEDECRARPASASHDT